MDATQNCDGYPSRKQRCIVIYINKYDIHYIHTVYVKYIMSTYDVFNLSMFSER